MGDLIIAKFIKLVLFRGDSLAFVKLKSSVMCLRLRMNEKL
jgi:hypothetical protein